MRNLIKKISWLLILIFAPIAGQSQSFFKFVDSETKKSVSRYDAEVIRNGYLNFAFIGKKDSDVYFLQPIDRDYNPKPEDAFFLSIDKQNYYPVWIEVDLKSKDTLLVQLEPDPNYRGEEKGLFYSWCGIPVMQKYYSKPFRQWDEIPEQTSKEIKLEMEHRLGKEAFSKVYISNAHIFETDRMTELGIPHNYPPGTISYRICFSFSDPEKGISQFTADGVFMRDGSVIKVPLLPQYELWKSTQENSWNVLSIEEIKIKALDEFGKSILEKDPSFQVYSRGNTFTWVFSQDLGRSPNGATLIKEIHYDAFSGEILAVFNDKRMIFYD